MVKYLIWTDRALVEYEELLDYLNDEWGAEITKKVGFEIEEKASHIQNNPEQYPLFIKIKKVRRCVASKQTSIYFKIFSDRIEIMAIIDNRRNPKTRNL